MSEKEKTYGYLKLNKNSFDNIIEKPNLTFDIPKSGYNFGATNYICENISKTINNSSFLDTIKVLKSKDRNSASNIIIGACMSEKTIVGEVPIDPNKSQYLLLDDIMFIARQTLASDKIENKRIAIPLTINSDDKEAHGVALCIDVNKGKKHANIIMLEQHSIRNNSSLDFSNEMEVTLSHLKQTFEEIGLSADTFYNDKPICREKGVCGIVSTEVCNILLNADNPIRIAQIGRIKINAYKIKELHNNNFLSYQYANPQALKRDKTKTR